MVQEEDYHQTRTYKAMDDDTKKLLARYKRENNVSNDQLYCQLYIMDLDNAPEEDKKAMSGSGVVMLLLAIVFLIFSILMESQASIIMACGVLFLVLVMLFSGAFNSFKKERARIRTRMSEMPAVISFEDWCKTLDD